MTNPLDKLRAVIENGQKSDPGSISAGYAGEVLLLLGSELLACVEAAQPYIDDTYCGTRELRAALTALDLAIEKELGAANEGGGK